MAGMNKEFLARIKLIMEGTAEAQAKLASIKNEMNSLGEHSDKNSKKMGDFEKAMRRALIVAPVWMAMREIIKGVVYPFQEILKAVTELDAGMAKIMTTFAVTGTEGQKMYKELSHGAWEYYINSSTSMKNITDAMYNMSKSGLSAEQVLLGFKNVMDLSEGTYTSSAEAAKLTVGVMQVFGDSLKNRVTDMEKMQYITDLLTNTINKHRTSATELSTVLGYVGTSADSMNISLEQVVGTIGFLNNSMLQGRRAGAALFAVFADISKDPQKLRNAGIIFDSRQPLDFLNIMNQLRVKFADNKDIATHTEMMKLFGASGAKAVEAIINDWDRWRTSIKAGTEDLDGAAKKAHELAESTFGAQMNRFLRLSFTPEGANLTGITGFLKHLNDTTEQGISTLEKYQKLVQYGFKIPEVPSQLGKGTAQVFFNAKENEPIVENINRLSTFLEKIGAEEIMKKLNKDTADASTHFADLANQARNYENKLITAGKSWSEIDNNEMSVLANLLGISEQETRTNKILKETYEYRRQNFNLTGKQIQSEASLLDETKKVIEQEELSTKYKIMKIAGAQEEVIAYAKITDEVKKLNDISSKQPQIEISDVLAGNFAKIVSLSSERLGDDKQAINLAKDRLNLELSIASAMQSQISKMTSLYLEYDKASQADKVKIRRMIEIQNMTAEQQKYAYIQNAADRELIQKNGNLLQPGAAEMIGKNIQSTNALSTPKFIEQSSLMAQLQKPAETPVISSNITNNITGASNINVNVMGENTSAPEVINKMVKAISSALFNDEDLLKKLAGLLSNKV